MLNGNGVAGSAADASFRLAQQRLRDGPAAGEPAAERADAGLLPHADLLRQAPEGLGGGGERAVEALRALGRRAAAQGPEAARARPGRDAHGRRGGDVPQPARDPAAGAAGAEARACRTSASTGSSGLDLAEAARAPGAVQARGADGARVARRTPTPVRRRAGAALLDRQEAPREGDPPGLQDRRRRVLGGRGDEHAEPADPRRPQLPARAQGPRRSRSTTRARTCTWSCCASTTGATGS